MCSKVQYENTTVHNDHIYFERSYLNNCMFIYAGFKPKPSPFHQCISEYWFQQFILQFYIIFNLNSITIKVYNKHTYLKRNNFFHL